MNWKKSGGGFIPEPSVTSAPMDRRFSMFRFEPFACRERSGEMGIGAGITYDSIAEEEWEESLLKGRFLTHSQPDFELFETILWQPDTGYWLLEEHLVRLASGAQFFKFSCDLEMVRSQLSREEAQFYRGLLSGAPGPG